MRKGESIILEPIMNVEIVTMNEYSSSVLADLSQRRCEIQNVDTRGGNKVNNNVYISYLFQKKLSKDKVSNLNNTYAIFMQVITAFVPLSNLLGYSTSLRSITSGNSTFTVEFSHYKAMESIFEEETIKRITGF